MKTNNKEEAQQKEIALILQFDTIKNGYNCLPGGTLSRLGTPHTEETKAKLSKANKGQIVTEEMKRKRSITIAAGKKRKLSEEARRKLSLAFQGKKKPPRTPEHAKKISNSLKKLGLKLSPEHKAAIQKANKGKKVSIETRKALSNAAKRQWDRYRAKNEIQNT